MTTNKQKTQTQETQTQETQTQETQTQETETQDTKTSEKETETPKTEVKETQTSKSDTKTQETETPKVETQNTDVKDTETQEVNTGDEELSVVIETIYDSLVENVDPVAAATLPKDKKEAIKVMRTQEFKKLNEKLSMVKEPSPSDKTEQVEDKKSTERETKNEGPKKWADVTPEMISDAFAEGLG